MLTELGLGWIPHAEFWIILVHESEKQLQRLKLRKNWFYEQNQPSTREIDQFHDRIDFNKGEFNHQMGSGWYWYEMDERGFRWTSNRAEFYLESHSSVNYLYLKGFSPELNSLKVLVDGIWIGDHPVEADEVFELKFLLPFQETKRRFYTVELETKRSIESRETGDSRDLGLMMFSMELVV